MAQPSQIFTGGHFSGPVGIHQTFTNCYNQIKQSARPDELKEALTQLTQLVEQLTPQIAPKAAKKVQDDLDMVVKQATSPEPRREYLQVSAEGIKEAAKTIVEIAPSIGTALTTIMRLLSL